MADARVVYLIGFWRGEHERPDLPDPCHPKLINPDWLSNEREALIKYLRSGHEAACMMGVSWCRLDCGVSDFAMGSRDFSDGTWVWPEGLPHYLESHDVILPAPFVAYARANEFVVPDAHASIACLRSVPTKTEKVVYNLQFWIDWYAGLISE